MSKWYSVRNMSGSDLIMTSYEEDIRLTDVLAAGEVVRGVSEKGVQHLRSWEQSGIIQIIEIDAPDDKTHWLKEGF
jgi:hypothetical protein